MPALAKFTALLFCACAPAAALADAERDVLARVAEFATAFRAADAERLADMLGPQYAHTNTGGSIVTRDQWLQYVQTRREELRSGTLSVTKYDNSNVEVRMHANVAIVTGVSSSAGARNGAPFTRKLRFTQVWLLTDGVWRRIAFHDTEVLP